MITAILRRFSALCLWTGVCVIFAFFTASGNLVAAAFIACILLGILLVIAGPQLLVGFWLVGQPTVFVFSNQVLKVLPFVTMERVFLLLLLGMLLLKIVFDKAGRLPMHKVEKLILVFLLYALASLAVHTAAGTVRQDIWFYMQYAIPLLMFIISYRIEWNERNLRLLFVCLTLVGVIISLSGVLQVLFGIDLLKADYKTIVRGHTDRAYGSFSNSHTYTATLLILFVVTLLQYSFSRDAVLRFAFCMAMAIMAAGIVLGQSRGPWIGFTGALLIIFLCDRGVRSLLLTGAGMAIVVGLGVLLMATDLDAFMHRVTTTGTLEGRFATWATAMNMVVHNPLFGLGFTADAYLFNKPEFMTGIGSLSAQYATALSVPHNEYLHVLVLLGIPGLVLFLTVLFTLVRQLFAIHRDTGSSTFRRKLGLYFGSIYLALMFNSFFSDTFMQDYFWMLAGFLAGLVIGLPAKFSAYNESDSRMPGKIRRASQF